MALLRDVFGDGLISRGIWPPRSLDLTPPDFCLWEAMKCAIYKHNPRGHRDLKYSITLLGIFPTLNWYKYSLTG